MEIAKTQEMFSMEDMTHNTKVITFCHTYMSIVAGIVAGIAGLTGLIGFLLFALLSLTTSFSLLVFKMKGKLNMYTTCTLPAFLLQGFSGHGLSYVLFWTLSFAMVHIY